MHYQSAAPVGDDRHYSGNVHSYSEECCINGNREFACVGSFSVSSSKSEYRAYDPETGASGTGDTRSVALAVLAARLGAEEGRDDAELSAELETLAERTRRRFEEEGVTEADIEDAITWARSE